MRCASLLALLLLFLLPCCGPDHDTLAGRYQARRNEAPLVSLELADDGTGAWTVEGGASMAFNWSVEQGKVVLRTRSGGLVAGRRNGDAIILQLPGEELLTFVPARQ